MGVSRGFTSNHRLSLHVHICYMESQIAFSTAGKISHLDSFQVREITEAIGKAEHCKNALSDGSLLIDTLANDMSQDGISEGYIQKCHDLAHQIREFSVNPKK